MWVWPVSLYNVWLEGEVASENCKGQLTSGQELPAFTPGFKKDVCSLLMSLTQYCPKVLLLHGFCPVCGQESKSADGLFSWTMEDSILLAFLCFIFHMIYLSGYSDVCRSYRASTKQEIGSFIPSPYHLKDRRTSLWHFQLNSSSGALVHLLATCLQPLQRLCTKRHKSLWNVNCDGKGLNFPF